MRSLREEKHGKFYREFYFSYNLLSKTNSFILFLRRCNSPLVKLWCSIRNGYCSRERFQENSEKWVCLKLKLFYLFF